MRFDMAKKYVASAIAGACALSLLAACGGGDGEAEMVRSTDGPQLEQRSANARRAGQSDADFAFVRYSIDVSGDLPRACLAFSSSLDPNRDYSGYLDISPATQTALSVDGPNLCIGGLTFGQSREVTIRSGLPAEDGRQLDFDETVEIVFGDRPAYVGFKGDGVILPRVEADGLALETVNVDAVRVKISRVTDRALAFKTITSGFSAAAGNYGYMEYGSDPSDVIQPVFEAEMETPGSPNAATTTVFPIAEAIPRLEPGAYFVELDQLDAGGDIPDNGALAKRWLIITDLALTTYTGDNGLFTTVRSIQSAKPVRNVRLELVAANNQILARGESTSNGHVRFPEAALRGEGPMAPRLVFAYGPNGDFAALDLNRSPVDLSERDIGGRSPAGEADAYIYLDRDIFRPGETVHATALIRDAQARAIEDRSGALVLYGPNGIEVERLRFDEAPEAGSVRHDIALTSSAARGDWRLTAEIDGIGQIGSTRFSVEDFVPQRIGLELDVDENTPLARNQQRAIASNVRFLYGAPGAGLPLEGEVRVEPAPNPFPDYAAYQFGRHDETFREQTWMLDEVTTDGAGNGNLLLDASEVSQTSSKPLRLRTVVSAIEPGGRAVRDDVRILYRPNDRYLGVKPAFENSAAEGQAARFDVVALDRSGQPQAGRVNWRLIRIDWKYDWYRAGGGDWQWRRSRNVVEVDEGSASITAAAPAQIATRELDWGDYELILTEGSTGAEASYGFWAGWGGSPQDGVEAPDRVRLSMPDTLPEVGRNIEIGILPPYDGEAEIVVAAENVIETRVVSVKAEGSRISLPVTREWGAGVYVMASVYTPRDPVERPVPRRAVGVAHVAVDMAPRTFELSLGVPEIQRPGEPMEITIDASSGPVREGAFVTVAAVDEGILMLTGFDSPDPVDYFFGKRRLGVALHDDYGRLLDPNQGAASALRTGGDQIGGAGLSVVPTKSVALYSGPVQLDRNGRATVTLDVPDFNGELRVMAVAFSETGLGASSEAVTVRDPVTAEMILPRFLSPGDTAQATLTIDNVEGQAGQYQGAISTTGSVTAGRQNVSTTLAEGQRNELSAQLSARTTGISEIELGVTGPGGFAVTRSYPIETRSAWLPTSYVERLTLAPGATYTPAPDALSSFLPGSGNVQVSFSPIPMDAAALFDSLDRYPYGCTEQVTSRAIPLLYANQMAALAGRQTDDEIRTNVQEAVSTLLSRQGGDGAIGMWRMGDRNATPWIGVYATDFLARAKAAGYVVPDAALDQAYDALETFAIQESRWSTGYDFDVWTSRWNPDTEQALMDRSVAYAAYVLARAGRMDRARLRYLHDERLPGIPSPLARAHIGAALHMIGDNARSNSAFNQAEQALGHENRGDYYQSARRDLAGVLALAAEADDTQRVERLAQRVGRDLPEPDRLNTQEKAFMLLAANALSDGATAANVRVDGPAQTVSQGGVFALADAELRAQPTFTNAGGGQLWVTRIARGAPASAPPPVASGLAANKQVWTPQGRAADGASFQQGDRLIVAISVAANSERETPLILSDLLPAGFEIEAVLQPSDAGESGPYAFLGDLTVPDVAEARDDRFVAAFDLFDRESKTVAYMVRAVTPGAFTMPGVVAEDMYRPDVFARTASRQITVTARN